MHISFVPILHGVPSAAESPHGTITVSSESVQYSSQGSSTKINICVNKISVHHLYGKVHSTLTTIEISLPLVLFSLKRFIIIHGTLLRSKTRFIFRTQFLIANFISNSFTHTKLTTIRWYGMITLSTLNRYTTTTRSRTFTPFVPIAPTAVNGIGKFFNWNALLMLAPLDENNFVKRNTLMDFPNLLYVSHNWFLVLLVVIEWCKHHLPDTTVANKFHPILNTLECCHWFDWIVNDIEDQHCTLLLHWECISSFSIESTENACNSVYLVVDRDK